MTAVLARPGGKIDLLGSGSFGGGTGFVIRLNPNGRLDRKFGKNGMRVLPFPVASAALGSEGATLAVSEEGVGGADTLMRILPNGRLDHTFGREGERIPQSSGDFRLSVVHQSRRKALVLDLGLQECRGYCIVDPKLVRFLEGKPKRR